ncbi:MAG TPA: EMC3/TMCO1 family protein [Candidatus Nanoarchaeia archaeon]|nr:EMC3/TMCO1 family protein [Candidatus Nanoarchaeia archaeon]
MVFEKLLDPVLSPLLGLPPILIMLILSLVISLIITLIYKYTTNQSLMKQLKDEIKEFQRQMKELKHDPSKMMEVQKKAMQTNMKYMMHSMRATLFTFIPIIIIFSWMSANLAYEPIAPQKEFIVTANFDDVASGAASIKVPEGLTVLGNDTQQIANKRVSFVLKGEEGNYADDKAIRVEYHEQAAFKSVMVTNGPRYAPVVEGSKSGNIKSIEINNEAVKVLNIFGWRIGWLGTYIIFSIAFSLGLRKLFKIY